MRKFTTTLAAIAATSLLGLAGCDTATTPPAGSGTASTTPAEDHGHEHGPGGEHAGHGAGPHDGTVADWGGGMYHVEFTVDHDQKSTAVYILGPDEKTPAPISPEGGHVLLTIDEPAFQVELTPEPLDGETKEKASKFVGTDDHLGTVREFSGSISASVDGTPYAGDFAEQPHGDHAH